MAQDKVLGVVPLSEHLDSLPERFLPSIMMFLECAGAGVSGRLHEHLVPILEDVFVDVVLLGVPRSQHEGLHEREPAAVVDAIQVVGECGAVSAAVKHTRHALENEYMIVPAFDMRK